MNTIHDLRQSQETCGEVLLVYYNLNAPPRNGQRKISAKTETEIDQLQKSIRNSFNQPWEYRNHNQFTEQKHMQEEDTSLTNVCI